MQRIKYKYLLTVCAFSIIVFLSACGTVDEEKPTCSGVLSTEGSGNNDVLVWSDEFDTDGLPCNENWTYDVGKGQGGWGNNEVQFYTRDKNAYVENGVLKITAKKQTYSGAEYTSARIKTQNRFSFTYGRVEVRAKLPLGGGTWPAIWMLGENITSVGWPTCGEIDIMEHRGNFPGEPSSAIHNSSGFGDTPYVSHPPKDLSVTSEFHIYAINWTKDKIEFIKDDLIHYVYQPRFKDAANWPFNKNQFIILNVAMGGTLGGSIDPNFTSSAMEIDYVRVYQ